MTKPRSPEVRDQAIDRYLSDPDLTISAAAAKVGVTDRTLTRWLAEHRERETAHVGA